MRIKFSNNRFLRVIKKIVKVFAGLGCFILFPLGLILIGYYLRIWIEKRHSSVKVSFTNVKSNSNEENTCLEVE